MFIFFSINAVICTRSLADTIRCVSLEGYDFFKVDNYFTLHRPSFTAITKTAVIWYSLKWSMLLWCCGRVSEHTLYVVAVDWFRHSASATSQEIEIAQVAAAAAVSERSLCHLDWNKPTAVQSSSHRRCVLSGSTIIRSLTDWKLEPTRTAHATSHTGIIDRAQRCAPWLASWRRG